MRLWSNIESHSCDNQAGSDLHLRIAIPLMVLLVRLRGSPEADFLPCFRALDSVATLATFVFVMIGSTCFQNQHQWVPVIIDVPPGKVDQDRGRRRGGGSGRGKDQIRLGPNTGENGGTRLLPFGRHCATFDFSSNCFCNTTSMEALKHGEHNHCEL